MKKFLIFWALCMPLSSFAQMTQKDLMGLFAEFKFSEMQRVNIYNIRLFFEDGTTRQSYESYPTNKLDYEARETSLYIKHFTDESKATLKGIYVIPYNKIRTVYVGKESLEISLAD